MSEHRVERTEAARRRKEKKRRRRARKDPSYSTKRTLNTAFLEFVRGRADAARIAAQAGRRPRRPGIGVGIGGGGVVLLIVLSNWFDLTTMAQGILTR